MVTGACDRSMPYSTFVSLSFHQDLRGLGYVDTGIFPNVRRVRDYETHGFKCCFAPA